MAFPSTSINYTSVAVKGSRVYASYAGLQQGITVRDLDLNQLSYFNTGINANGIAAGPNDDVYIAAGNHIYHYGTNGNLIRDMAFPSSSINYTDVSVLCDTVYASYNGSQQGFTVRDLELNQRSYVAISADISSIAAGPNADAHFRQSHLQLQSRWRFNSGHGFSCRQHRILWRVCNLSYPHLSRLLKALAWAMSI